MASQEAYYITPDEFNLITQEAWEGEGCPECQGLLQSIEQDKEGQAFIHPTPSQAEHMSELFGYSADTATLPVGYLDPNDPSWQRSAEHIAEKQKEFAQNPEKGKGFGPQSGMMRGEPTRDEWQITSYLKQLGIPYIHKMKLGELDPSIEKPMTEFDIYIPEFAMAIETSPGWHEGGPHAKNFPDVVANDQFKRQWAKSNGIDLMSFDPANGTEDFINSVLVPKLRSLGVDAFEVHKKEEEEEVERDFQRMIHPEAEGVVSEHEWNQPMGGAPSYQEQMNYHRCEYCGELIDPVDEYHTHEGKRYTGRGKSEARPTRGQNACPVCGYGENKFWDKYELTKHLKEFHPEDYALIQQYDFENEPKEESIDSEYDSKCPNCNHMISNIDYFCNDENCPCEGCGYSYDYDEPEVKQEEKCPNCGKELQTYVDPYGTRKCGWCNFKLGYRKQEVGDQSQNLPLFPNRGQVNTSQQTDQTQGNDLYADNRLFYEEKEEDVMGTPEVGPIGDFFVHKSQGQVNQGKGQEFPMQTNYGYQEEAVTQEVEKFGPIVIDYKTGKKTYYAVCVDDYDEIEDKDYDVIADWALDHLSHKHPDDMYSPTMHPGVDPEGLPIGYTIDEITSMREEEKKESELAILADEYNAKEGLPEIKPVKSIKKPDEKEGKRIADVYDQKKHDPNNPKVKAAYKAFKADTLSQYEFIKANGIKFEFSEKDPYPDQDIKTMEKDILENGRLIVFTGGKPLQSDHPLAENIPNEDVNYNSVFRGVHDLFGHIAHDNPITFSGEFYAFLSHLQMYSSEARSAMTWETLANTNWFQYIGKGKTFAPQKANIYTDIPSEWLSQKKEEYPVSDQRNDKGNPYSMSPMLYRHVG